MSDTEHEYFEDFYECDGCQSRHRVGVECPLRNPHELLAQLTAAQQRVAELDAALRDSNAATLRWMEAAGKLDGDNASLREQLAELEQKLQIIKTQLSNIEWNLQRQDNPSKDDWLRMIRNMLESLK